MAKVLNCCDLCREVRAEIRNSIFGFIRDTMDKLIIAGRQFNSRLLVGTGKFASSEIMADAMEKSGTEIVTVALRRVDIENENDDMLIVLTKQGDLESGNPGFVSGQTGWQISYKGDAEFNNLFVRGELHATVFVADEMHATGGTLAVMTASKVGESIMINVIKR